MNRCSSYLHRPFASKMSFMECADKAILQIRKAIRSGLRVDSIVCSGVSGMAIAPIVAHSLGLKLVVVRKSDENSHAHVDIEGLPHSKDFNFIIVDDFVESGETIVRILNRIANCRAKQGYRFKGCYLYNHESFYDTREMLREMRGSSNHRIARVNSADKIVNLLNRCQPGKGKPPKSKKSSVCIGQRTPVPIANPLLEIAKLNLGSTDSPISELQAQGRTMRIKWGELKPTKIKDVYHFAPRFTRSDAGIGGLID